MKNKLFFILLITLAAIATVLVGLKILQYARPQKIEKEKAEEPDFAFGVLPQPEIKSLQFPETINYTSSIPQTIIENLPKIVPVYFLETQEINLERATKIGQVFDFSDQPKRVFTATPSALLYFQWKDKNHSLKVKPSGQIVYQYFAAADPSLKNPTALPSEEIAVDIIKENLARLAVKESEKLNFQPKISYEIITPSVFMETQNKEEAEVIKIELVLLADNLPIMLNNPKVTPIMGRVGNEGKLLHLILSLYEINWQKNGTYPLKTMEQVLTDLQANQGKIVSLENINLPPGAPVSAKITNINLTGISLAYYHQENTRYLQPIFILSGTAITNEGQMLNTTLYLPAVASTTPGP